MIFQRFQLLQGDSRLSLPKYDATDDDDDDDDVAALFHPRGMKERKDRRGNGYGGSENAGRENVILIDDKP